MTNVIRRVLPVVLPFLLSACVFDTFDMRLSVVNKTPAIVFITLSPNGRFTYPVVIDITRGDTVWNEMRWSPPRDSSAHMPPSLGSWEEYINKKCEDSTLTVFMFDTALLTRVPLDSLVAQQLYTKKFTYKARDLEKLKWRVAYN